MRKPWHFFVLGMIFWVAIMLADLDFSLASSLNALRGRAQDDLHSDEVVMEVCKARQAQIGLVLIQYWVRFGNSLLASGSHMHLCLLSNIWLRTFALF